LIPLQQLKQVVAQQLKDNAEVPLKVEMIKAPNNMMLIPWIMLCVEHMKNANLNFGLCVIRKLILNDFDSYIHVCLSCIAPCHLPKGSLTNQLLHNISVWQTQITRSILSPYNCPFLPHTVPTQKQKLIVQIHLKSEKILLGVLSTDKNS
jgi:hypothetical protein